jgi:hypothetical protein
MYVEQFQRFGYSGRELRVPSGEIPIHKQEKSEQQTMEIAGPRWWERFGRLVSLVCADSLQIPCNNDRRASACALLVHSVDIIAKFGLFIFGIGSK